jgi:hypothetical protein
MQCIWVQLLYETTQYLQMRIVTLFYQLVYSVLLVAKVVVVIFQQQDWQIYLTLM